MAAPYNRRTLALVGDEPVAMQIPTTNAPCQYEPPRPRKKRRVGLPRHLREMFPATAKLFSGAGGAILFCQLVSLGINLCTGSQLAALCSIGAGLTAVLWRLAGWPNANPPIECRATAFLLWAWVLTFPRLDGVAMYLAHGLAFAGLPVAVAVANRSVNKGCVVPIAP